MRTTGKLLCSFIIGALTLCSIDVNAQKRPPNYSQDDMPITGFSCREKIVGGYYADPETDCQMFHVCVHLPGVGIQDFRFLCPNDTSFDQEHQICDDWYNIDCELSSSYYSDNFDLYRIGVNHEVKKPPLSQKGTPIPLGPSTTIKPWQQPTKNQPHRDEDDYKNSGNDIFRGSHSSNFFSNKNYGREDVDDDDEYDTSNVGAQRQEVYQQKDLRKQKTLIRKVTNKRPVTQTPVVSNPTLAASAFAFPSTSQRSSSQYSSNAASQYQYTGNKVTKPRGKVNYGVVTNKPTKPSEYQTSSTTTAIPSIYQRINNLPENNDQDISEETPVTQIYDLNKTYKNSQHFRQPSTSTYNTPKYYSTKTTFPSSTPAALTQTESLRLPSTAYLQNIAQSYQQPAAIINNQLQDTSANAYSQPNQYDIYKKSHSAGTKSAFASYDNYQQQYDTYKQPSSYTVNVPQTAAAHNDHHDAKQPSTDVYSSHSYPTTATYLQPNATSFDYYKYYQTATGTPVTQKARAYFSSSPTFNDYQQSTTNSPPKYDPYASFQKVNEKYDDDEFLKTAYSSNLKPSDLNTIHNQKKQSYINATLKAAYSVDQPKSPHNAYNVQSSTSKLVSPKPTSNYKSADTIKSTVQHKVPHGLLNLAQNSTSKVNSPDYDYAYYDNVESSEYDHLETVEEDFPRIQKANLHKS